MIVFSMRCLIDNVVTNHLIDVNDHHYCSIIYRTTKIKYMFIRCIKIFVLSYYITINFTYLYITFDFSDPMLFSRNYSPMKIKNKIKNPVLKIIFWLDIF